jgi:xylulokinase
MGRAAVVTSPAPHAGSSGGPFLLGIDLGTSAVKALVVGPDGTVAGRGRADHVIERPEPDRAEQEPEEWWAAVVRAVREALVGGHLARGIVAIGLSAQTHGAVLVDSVGMRLGRAIIWPDRRSGEQVAALMERLGRERVIDAIGGPLATGFQAPTLLWLREHEAERFARIGHVLAPKDWLRLRLTGRIATDPSDASGTGFLEARGRAWWPPMAEAVGLDPSHLPPLADGPDAAGPLLPAPAAALGLPPGIPVAIGAADTPCGLLGAGLVTPDAFLVSISTGATVVVPSRKVVVDPLGRTHTLSAAIPPGPATAGWYRMGATLSAGASLRWLRDGLFGLEGEDAYDRMVAWAAESAPAAGGLVFLPYLSGERTPHMDPDARGAFVGLTLAHDRGDLVRAVLEGVALSCVDAAEALDSTGGLPATFILAGGGARSELWASIFADAFGRPFRRLATEEQAALGACLLAGAAVGAFEVAEAARSWVRLGPLIEPDPGRHARYLALRAPFAAAYRGLRPSFDRLARGGDARPGRKA